MTLFAGTRICGWCRELVQWYCSGRAHTNLRSGVRACAIFLYSATLNGLPSSPRNSGGASEAKLHPRTRACLDVITPVRNALEAMHSLLPQPLDHASIVVAEAHDVIER